MDIWFVTSFTTEPGKPVIGNYGRFVSQQSTQPFILRIKSNQLTGAIINGQDFFGDTPCRFFAQNSKHRLNTQLYIAKIIFLGCGGVVSTLLLWHVCFALRNNLKIGCLKSLIIAKTSCFEN